MCCVCSHARMASSTSLCLGFAVPIIFHESPMVAFILCRLLTILFLSQRLPVQQPVIPLACSFIVSLLSEVPSQHGSVPGTHHVCSPAHWQKQLALPSITALVPMRYQLITFSFYFNLGVILIYSPRSYEAGAFLISALRGLPPALDNDFSMNLPFSLPTSLCLWAINKTCIHR